MSFNFPDLLMPGCGTEQGAGSDRRRRDPDRIGAAGRPEAVQKSQICRHPRRGPPPGEPGNRGGDHQPGLSMQRGGPRRAGEGHHQGGGKRRCLLHAGPQHPLCRSDTPGL